MCIRDSSCGAGGHNGGDIQFGPDGMLYIPVGDLAPPDPPDPRNDGQNLATIAGAISRIDVDRRDPGLPYGIPKDNPFVDIQVARPEIWAFGFRNPWKMDFHPKTSNIWLGDVGWELYEMVHRVERRANGCDLSSSRSTDNAGPRRAMALLCQKRMHALPRKQFPQATGFFPWADGPG